MNAPESVVDMATALPSMQLHGNTANVAYILVTNFVSISVLASCDLYSCPASRTSTAPNAIGAEVHIYTK